MTTIPFLVQFKKERSLECSDILSEIKYNNELDYNIITNLNTILLNTMTKTSVKDEQPDEIKVDSEDQFETSTYLKTQTITRVKTEEPDEIDDLSLMELMATQTFTKSVGETNDTDFN